MGKGCCGEVADDDFIMSYVSSPFNTSSSSSSSAEDKPFAKSAAVINCAAIYYTGLIDSPHQRPGIKSVSQMIPSIVKGIATMYANMINQGVGNNNPIQIAATKSIHELAAHPDNNLGKNPGIVIHDFLQCLAGSDYSKPENKSKMDYATKLFKILTESQAKVSMCCIFVLSKMFISNFIELILNACFNLADSGDEGSREAYHVPYEKCGGEGC